MNSITVKMRRLGISRRARGGWYTKSDISELIGCDHKWVQKRIDSGQLVASYHYGSRPSFVGQSAWHIEADDLSRFIRRFPEDLQGRNVDMVGLVDLLAGVIHGRIDRAS